MSRVLRCAGLLVPACLSACPRAPAQAGQPFTLKQALSAPYATDLTAAPAGDLFAWVEDAEGRHNLWVGGAYTPARMLTHNTEDDAQDIASPVWSPDGKQIAFVFGAETGADGKPANPAHLQRPTPVTIMLQDVAPGGAARNLGEGRAPLFLPDGRGLLFVRAGQIWQADLTPGGTTHQLVIDRGSASQLALSHDGSLLAFTSTRHDGGHEHSYVALFDLRSRMLGMVAPSTGSDFAAVFSPDSRWLAWLRKPFTEPAEYAPNRVSANPWSLQLADLSACSCAQTQECELTSRTLYSPRAKLAGSVLPHMATGSPQLFFLPDGRLIYPSEEDGWNHLYLLDWQHRGGPVLLTPGPYEVEDATLGAGGRTLLFSSNDPAEDMLNADRRHLYRIDLTMPAQQGLRVQALTEGIGIETRPHEVQTNVAALASGVHEPMHPVVTGRDGAAKPLHDGWLPQDYPGARFVTPKQVLLRARDGVILHAQLFEPPTPLAPGHRRAALLFFHGGPNRQMMLGFPPMDYYSNAYAMNQYLASRGFLVLSVNYRCGIGYGLKFRQCEHAGPEGGREYIDVLAGAAWLRARQDVDRKRIGLWGGSYGGYLTALALARNSDLFAAGVDFHGVHKWGRGSEEPETWLRGGSAEEDRRAALAHKSSPMADVKTWRSPVLLIHGDDDSHVAYNQTPMLADALRARGVPVEELIFPDETHGFLLHRDWLRAYQATAEFLERRLRPEQ